jgi:hypothetical protein
MPNQLKAGSHRVSYVEESSTSKALSILAAAKGVTVSALIREANMDYLKKHDPSGEVLAIAKKLSSELSDQSNDRVKDKLDAETTEVLGKLLKRLKK